MSPLRSRRVAVLCVVLLLVVTGCTDGLLVPEPEGVDDPEPETSLCGTDGNDPCEMDEVVVEEIWDPPPAFPDPIDEPLPGGPDDPGSIPTIPPDDPENEVTPTGPPGVPQEFFQSLNPREKELCWASPLECAQVALSKSEAEDFAEDAGYYSGVPGPHNGPQDALRHAMWSAEMAQRIGANQAEVWGTAHEMDFNLEPPAPNMSNPETVMDLYNNQVGRNIGVNTSGDLRQAILDALDNGLLQEWVCPEIGSGNPANCRS